MSCDFTLLFLLAPFCSPILEPHLFARKLIMTRVLLTRYTPSIYNSISETCRNYLYSSFCQLDTNCEFLPKENVGIMGLLKSTFQLLQLKIGKCGTIPTLLPFADDAGWSLFAFRASREIICYKKIQFIRDNILSTKSS